MSARLPWFLLAVSLAANLFFGAGVAYTVYQERRVAASPEARVDVVAERLGLDDKQHQALMLLRERAEYRRPGLKQAEAPVRAEILKQVAQPEFDRELVLEMLAQRDEERRPYLTEYAEDLHGFLVTLNDDQRRQFLEMALEPGFLRHVYMGQARKGRDSDEAQE
jgi:uncharacterized membrane protein